MHDIYIEIAIKEAKKALKNGEVPVGAIIVKNGRVVAKAHNTVEKKKNATNHAEINAIKKASRRLGNWRLIDCDLYVTLEPCEMCSGAIKLSRIRNVFYATPRDKKNNESKIINSINIENHNEECLKMLQNFFKKKRG